jgi:hypothetical protein
MNEDELRRRVSKRRKIPEQAWAFFLERGYVEDALMKDDDEEKVRFIVEEFDRHKAAFAGTRGRRQTPDQESSEVPVPLGDSELERKGASEEYAALRAARNGGTRWFREEVLRNRLLTAEQARELIRSPAARFLEENMFEFAGGEIPLIGHHATLEAYERVEGGTDWEVLHRAIVSVEPPGMTETVENMFDETPQPGSRTPRFKDRTDGQPLCFVNNRGRARKVSVWEWYLLERLRHLSEGLAQEFRWEPAQSTMFVLTGEIPAIPPLKVMGSLKSEAEILEDTTRVPIHIDATINITASPWVPARTVTRAYREAQTKILGSRGGKPPSVKNLQLFRFVIERIQALSEPAAEAIASREPGRATRMPKGKELVGEWNEAHPRWAYKTSVGDVNTRLFWRDFKRILKTIAVGPPYQGYRAAADRQPGPTDGS